MKRASHIASVESKAFFEESLLENFVNSIFNGNGKKIMGKNQNNFSPGYENIEWRSAHIPVTGTIEIMAYTKEAFKAKRISIPVSSGFLVICTKEREGKFKITWNCSMS